ncbi:MAG: hypothetical protein QQW96_22875 [Tychonema bourrellyi B0820]|nr:hypothetical protein [Tychonema bourrellyi B0820]
MRVRFSLRPLLEEVNKFRVPEQSGTLIYVDRESGMGHRAWGMGNWAWGMGHGA